MENQAGPLMIIDEPFDPKAVTVGVDPAAKKPTVTIWRADEHGNEYADVAMATPEDLARLQNEVPLTDAQVNELAKKIAKRMLRADLREKTQKTRLRKNKAAKASRRRNR